MIEYLIDTDWLVDYLKGRQYAVDGLSPLIRRQAMGTTIITYAEIYEGLLGAPSRQQRQREFDRLLDAVPLYFIGVAEAQIFAALRHDLRRRGEQIPDLDLFIAAVALHNNLALVSNDTHFQRIPGLGLTKAPA